MKEFANKLVRNNSIVGNIYICLQCVSCIFLTINLIYKDLIIRNIASSTQFTAVFILILFFFLQNKNNRLFKLKNKLSK